MVAAGAGVHQSSGYYRGSVATCSWAATALDTAPALAPALAPGLVSEYYSLCPDQREEVEQ